MGVLQHNSVGSTLHQSEYEGTTSHLIGGVAGTNIVRSAAFVVAASNAPQHVRAQADYVCDGVADNVEIQAAIDALSSFGGRVLLSEGTFSLSAGININKHYVTLEGQGYGAENSTLLLPAGQGSTTLQLFFNGTAIYFTQINGYKVRGTTLQGFGMYGNYATYPLGRGIDLTSTWETLVSRVKIYSFDYGVMASGALDLAWLEHVMVVDAGTAHFYFSGASQIHLTNCYANTGASVILYQVRNCSDVRMLNCVADGGSRGFFLYAEGVGTVSNDHYLIGCRAYNCSSYGFGIEAVTQGLSTMVTLIGNHAGATITGDGFLLNPGASSTVRKTMLIANTAEDCSSYGLRFLGSGTLDQNNIQNNDFSSCVSPFIDSNSGSHTGNIIRNNQGYVTENSGTGTINNGATTAVITHSCNYTPVLADITVTLGENPSNTPGAIWVDTITSTQFTVNCENDPGASNLDFSWAVRKV